VRGQVRKAIPAPVSGGLILSYRCSAACQHCMYGCTPDWSADWISEEYLKSVLSSLCGKIVPSPGGPDTVSLNYGIHLTGGEPFLNYGLLLSACRMCAELDIPSTFVETNCFWCADEDRTRELLLRLRDNGLKGMLVSVNPFYLEYVPFERTRRAIRIGREIFGRNLMVYQLEYYRRFTEAGIEGKVSLDDYFKCEGQERFLADAEFFLLGRACYRLGKNQNILLPRYSAERFFRERCIPPFLRSWHNHFDNYANYVPGYCGGISLGDIRELDSLLEKGIDPDEYPVLALLMEEDLEGLLMFGMRHGYTLSEEGYLSRCHLCIDIRRHLVEQGGFRELFPVEFYRHLD